MEDYSEKARVTSIKYPITPVAKPRMSNQDRYRLPPPNYTGKHWPRPCVAKWRAFEDEVALRRVVLPTSGAFIRFTLPVMKSWSKAKKAFMIGAPHETTPDLSNLLKALEDACFVDDRVIWHYAGMEKRWGWEGSITITDSGLYTVPRKPSHPYIHRTQVMIHGGNPAPGVVPEEGFAYCLNTNNIELTEGVSSLGSPAVQDLGWANNWREDPEIVKRCRGYNHKPTSAREGSFDHEVRCDLCGYVYMIDTS